MADGYRVVDYIVDCLAGRGIRHLFGVDGANIEDLYDAAADREELTAVLVGWCRLAGVPLPKAGEKAIEPADDGVTLAIVQRGLGRPSRLH